MGIASRIKPKQICFHDPVCSRRKAPAETVVKVRTTASQRRRPHFNVIKTTSHVCRSEGLCRCWSFAVNAVSYRKASNADQPVPWVEILIFISERTHVDEGFYLSCPVSTR